jgi:hypothetical protein
MLIAPKRYRTGKAVGMRTERWPSDESDNDGANWTGTASTVLGAVLRWLIVLLARHYSG